MQRDKGSLNLDQWLEKLKSNPNPSDLDKARIKCITDFLNGNPIKKKNYAAWVNSYRNYLVHNVFTLIDDVELASGGKTKYNREVILDLPKDHHFDALCVGEVPEQGFEGLNQPVLYIKAQGRGNRLRGNTNACGIITVKYKDNSKAFVKCDKDGNITHNFITGDIVKANIPGGKYAGQHVGRITIRKSGSFALKSKDGLIPCVNYKYCQLLQRADGYSYSYKN